MKLISLMSLFLISAQASAPVSPSVRDWPSKNWGLYESGKAGVGAIMAQKLVPSDVRVSVAVIDTGIDSYHPALCANVDRRGYDFSADVEMPNPRDLLKHGTHVAGIIEAVSGNRAELTSVKYYDARFKNDRIFSDLVKAVNYAVDHDVKIINYSGGGSMSSDSEKAALIRAYEKGIVVVVAAGNHKMNLDTPGNEFYPASYQFPNIISVMNVDRDSKRDRSSDWGRTTVSVAAPGSNIYSTLPSGKYGYMTGTSQSTAFVTGIVVMMLAVNPNLTPVQIKKILIKTSDPVAALRHLNASGGRVNAIKAVTAAKNFTK